MKLYSLRLLLNVCILSGSNHLPYCLVVRITGFHPVGPGSIPGMGTFLHKFYLIQLTY